MIIDLKKITLFYSNWNLGLFNQNKDILKFEKFILDEISIKGIINNSNKLKSLNNKIKKQITEKTDFFNEFCNLDILNEIVTRKFLNHIFKDILKLINPNTSEIILLDTKIQKDDLSKALYEIFYLFFKIKNKDLENYILEEYQLILENIICDEIIKQRLQLIKRLENYDNRIFSIMKNISKIIQLIFYWKIPFVNIEYKTLENEFNVFIEQFNKMIKNTSNYLKMNSIDLYSLEKIGSFDKIDNKLLDSYNLNSQEQIIKYFFGNFYNINIQKKILKIILGYFKIHNENILNKIKDDLIQNKKKNNLEVDTLLDTHEFKNCIKYFPKNSIKSINPDLADILSFSLDDKDKENKIKNIIRENQWFSKNEFKNIIINFFEKNYKNNYNKSNLEKLLLYYSDSEKQLSFNDAIINVINRNYANLNDKSIEQAIYNLVYSFEMRNSDKFDDFEIILDNYDERQIKDELWINLNKYSTIISFDDIDPICFVDNNLLSIRKRLRFSEYEKKGDILYKFIIIWLILDTKIKYYPLDIYLSAKFQNELCKSLNLEKIIKSNGLHFNYREYQIADYFESLIYNIYKENSDFIKLRDFILKLFEDNMKEYLITENEINKVNEYFKDDEIIKQFYNNLNLKFTIIFPLKYNNQKDLLFSLFNQLIFSIQDFVFLEDFQKKLNLNHEYFSQKRNIYFDVIIHKEKLNLLYQNIFSLLNSNMNKFFNQINIQIELILKHNIDI